MTGTGLPEVAVRGEMPTEGRAIGGDAECGPYEGDDSSRKDGGAPGLGLPPPVAVAVCEDPGAALAATLPSAEFRDTNGKEVGWGNPVAPPRPVTITAARFAGPGDSGGDGLGAEPLL